MSTRKSYRIDWIKCLILSVVLLSCGRLNKEDYNLIRETVKASGMDYIESLETNSLGNLTTSDADSQVPITFSPTESPIRIDIIRGKLGIPDLPPSHRVERVVTDDINLIHSFEQDASVYVYYLPENINTNPTVEKPYEIDCTNDAIECNEFLESTILQLSSSPFYLIVPIDYELPDNLDAEFLFETYFPPRTQSTSEEHNRINPLFVTGTLKSYDNRLNQYTPIANAEISYVSIDSGLQVLSYTYTNALGEFTLYSPSSQSWLKASLENSKYKVRAGMSTSVYSLNLGTLSDLLPSNSFHIDINLPVNYSCDVYKAAQYYFYSSNALLDGVTRYDSTGNIIDIYAVDSPDPDHNYLGYFMPSSSPYIVIYNAYLSNYTGASSKVFGTVLHELGHATSYATLGQTNHNNIATIVKESFASFFGWYNVAIFYSNVASTHSLVHSICTQGRQNWTLNSQSNYTPFYVDLFDEYNQYLYVSSYNNDPISYVPAPVIASLGIGPQSLSTVVSNLASYIGLYFTQTEYNTFISPYSSLL